MGIVAPLPNGCRYSGKIRFIEKQGGKWAQEICAGCPKQRYATGEPGNVQGTGPSGFVEGSSGYRAHVVKVQVRDLVRDVEIVAPFATRGRNLGKMFRAPGCKWLQETCAGFRSSGAPLKSQAKFRGGTKWGL